MAHFNGHFSKVSMAYWLKGFRKQLFLKTRELGRAVNKSRAFSGAFSIFHFHFQCSHSLFCWELLPFSVLSLEKAFSSVHPSSERTGAFISDSLFLLRHNTLKNPLPLDVYFKAKKPLTQT